MSFFSPLPHMSMFTLVLLYLFLRSVLIFPFASSASLSINSDKDALIAFKSQLNLQPSNPLSSWHQNSPSPCKWTGVFCNEFGHRVVGLNLSDLELSGSISPHITNLSFLHSLQLQNNQLTGTLPDISNLHRLRVLNLSYNRLEGSIPLNLSKLSGLKVLDLMGNKIAGRIPKEISFLTKLQVLNLGRNLLWGSIPQQIANLSSLVLLNLGTNTFHGMIPSSIGRMRNLKYFDLTVNNLTGTIPSSIYNMSSLVQLAVASNQLWGTIPYDVGHRLPNLLVFIFCYNKFTGKIPGSLHNLTNIEIVRMAHNLLEGTVPPGLGNLPFLKMYNIGYNRIVNSGDDGLRFITSLRNSSNLAYLSFDGNLLRGEIPESIGNLSKTLSKLYMGGNQIYGQIPAPIGHLSGLTLLDISDNAVTGDIPNAIGQLEDLQVLSLARNQLSGNIPDSLGNLHKLNRIELCGNELEGEIPSSFGNFESLQSMDLSCNKLNGSIPKEILNLPSLTIVLNLSNNFLSGNFPPEINLLENLIAIDLSNNSLSGEIPSTIKSCKCLEDLRMSRNGFSGPIPPSVGELQGLEILDLSYNHLIGSIPSNLQNLHALQSLNLSFNHLEGSIPCGGVFKNPGAQLMGNPKLFFHMPCESYYHRRRRPMKIVIIVTVSTIAIFLAISYLLYLWKIKVKATRQGSDPLLKEQYPMIKYDELRRATGNFNAVNLIGSGAFGSVYKGQLLGDCTTVAIKVLNMAKTGSHKSFLTECMALRNVRHRSLVKLITSCSSIDVKNTEFFALVYEYLGNGSLEDWVTGKKKKVNGEGLNLLERLNVAIDVASALVYLHHDCEVPVVHCDLKPSNVLLDMDMTAKIGDFGLARLLLERLVDQHTISSTHVLKGSIGYMPPEYGLGVKPSITGDVYSFGVTLLELFTGKSPTHESFMGGKTLVGWVQSAFPTSILPVLDPQLLKHTDSLHVPDDVSCHPYPMNLELQSELDCLIMVLGVGLSCTIGYPCGRLNMNQALCKLQDSRITLVNPVRIKNHCRS